MQNLPSTSLEQCFDTLDIDAESSWPDVQKHYRQLVQQWHPDRHDEASHDQVQPRFIEINNAYQQLRSYYLLHGTLPRQAANDESITLLEPRPKVSFVRRHASLPVVLSALGGLFILLFLAGLLVLEGKRTQQNRAEAEQVHIDNQSAPE